MALRDIGEQVLVIMTAHTGNNIFCTPALQSLIENYPGTEFSVLCLKKQSAEVFEGNPGVKHIYVSKKVATVSRLARLFTHAICLHPKSNYLLESVGCPCYPAPRWELGTHYAEQILRSIANYIGCSVEASELCYTLYGDDPAAPSLLDGYPRDSGAVMVNLHLGCGRTMIHGWKFFYGDRAKVTKIWPVERYIELAHQLLDLDPKIRLVLTGTRHEAFLGREFEKTLPNTINLIGGTSIAQLYRVVSDIDLFISQDSGTLHIAAAAGVPLIGLYGSTDPSVTGPFPSRPEYRVIKKEDMASISADEVAHAALDMINRFSPPGQPAS